MAGPRTYVAGGTGRARCTCMSPPIPSHPFLSKANTQLYQDSGMEVKAYTDHTAGHGQGILMTFSVCLSEIDIHKKFRVRSFNCMAASNISLLGGAIETGFFGVVCATLPNNFAKLPLNSCMATHSKMTPNISVLGGGMEPYLTSCWAWPWHPNELFCLC